MLALPLLIMLMAGIGLGAGMIFSSLTTKYRDLSFLLSFGVQLLMYATPVIYPVSTVPERYRLYILMNPVAPVVEAFRYAFLGSGHFSWQCLGYSGLCMTVLLMSGILIFNKVEKSFMDTV